MEKLVSKSNRLANYICNSISNAEKTAKDKRTTPFLNARLQLLQDYWSRFSQVYDELCDLGPGEKGDKVTEPADYSAVECSYLEGIAWLREELERQAIESSQKCSKPLLNSDIQPSSTPQAVRLPKIDLPSFNGSYLDWPSFSDTYCTLIHSNASLTAVQKLHYLKSVVSGEADNLLKHLAVTAANYPTAWGILTERFENVRVLVNANIKAIMTIKSMSNELSSELRRVLDGFKQYVRALENLKRPVNYWDDWLVYLLADKLDATTRKDWEMTLTSSKEVPTFRSLVSFLESRVHILDAVQTNCQPKVPGSLRPNNRQSRAFHVTTSRDCSLCRDKHLLLFCPKFRAKTVPDRWNFIQEKKLCNNCLKPGHFQTACPSQNRCKHCNKSHHTMLHSESTILPGPSLDSATPNFTRSHLSSSQVKYNNILLATARVYVKSQDGHLISTRALLDQGSESNFISSSLATRIKVPKVRQHVAVVGIGQCKAATAVTAMTPTIVSKLNSTTQYTLNALVLPKLTDLLPPKKLLCHDWPHLQGLELADPEFNQPASIDLILGAEVYAQILKDGVKKGPIGTPIAQATTLGWILSGPVNSALLGPSATTSVFHSSATAINDILQKFWEVEEPPKVPTLTTAELECEEIYKETHCVNPCGRYVIRLPFSEEPSKLGHSRTPALHALLRMEKRFEKDADLYEQYSTFIHEYLSLGHMELVEREETNADRCYYLPHHAVMKPTSTTTKLRVVFNASQKTSSGISLNDILHPGRKVQNDILPTLLKWRFYPFVLSGDIEKMYRQILVHTNDCDFQRILWRDKPNEPVRCYRLKTVTYGTASAPYLACRTLHQLADDYQHVFPNASRVLKENFYVDDALFGAYDLPTALQIRDDLRTLLKKAGFNLRKWLANAPQLLEGIPTEDKERSESIKLVNDADFKALGIGWTPSTDTCHFHFHLVEISTTTTKRTILSDIGHIYDPLGWLAPTIISSKIFLQKLWLAKVDWDEELAADLTTLWIALRKELIELHQVRIPRWIGVTSPCMPMELHGFCDASLSAYGTAIYVRVVRMDNKPHTSLLVAKTRVSPLKTISLPRLELCGATILADLMETTLQHLPCQPVKIFMWTDSTIVLSWLREQPVRWKVYIANRVALIHSKVPTASWRHVRSDQNPADCLTRGLSATELINSQLWWSGPTWLSLDQDHWPHTEVLSSPSALTEVRYPQDVAVRTFTVQIKDPDIEMLRRYSSLSRLLHVTAYCLRFCGNAKVKPVLRNRGPLMQSEVEAALLKWIKLVQGMHFAAEIKSVMKREPVSSSSKLKALMPFIGEDSILRVGGRLKNALLNYAEKHPIILPRSSTFTNLLIRHVHLLTLHGGVQLTLHQLRTKYWILNGRDSVRNLIRKCVTCCRHRATTNSQLMASLPADRVRPTKPFLNSGVDYAGPFSVTPIRRRGQRAIKSYVAVFLCMSTRAIHLELVHDLSAEAFVAAFRRFTSRRGRCAKLYSDNATNFVGAEKQLSHHFSQLSSDPELAHMLLKDQTEWHFIPPASPHFGGLWEAGVKACKHHLKRVVSDHILSVEEMSTLLAQIEACLNSRPMYAMSDDPEDLHPITPGHFLLGEAPLTVPGLELQEPRARLNRWEVVQSMMQHFWRRWSKEYISTLQLRGKWQKPQQNLETNNMVLIKEDNLPPSKWRLGRVVTTHPGEDGNVRVVTIRHVGGLCKRPVTKLCVLPVQTT